MKNSPLARAAKKTRKPRVDKKGSNLLSHDLILNKTPKTKNGQRKQLEKEQTSRLGKNLVRFSFRPQPSQNAAKSYFSATVAAFPFSFPSPSSAVVSTVESKVPPPLLPPKPKEEHENLADKQKNELVSTAGLPKEDIQEIQKKLKELVVKYFNLKKKLLDEEYNVLIALVSNFGSACALSSSVEGSKAQLPSLSPSLPVSSLAQKETNQKAFPQGHPENSIPIISAIEETTEKQLSEHFPLFSSSSPSTRFQEKCKCVSSFSLSDGVSSTSSTVSSTSTQAVPSPSSKISSLTLAADSIALPSPSLTEKAQNNPILAVAPAAPFVKELKSILKNVHFARNLEQIKVFESLPEQTPPGSPFQEIVRPSFDYAVGENLLKMERAAYLPQSTSEETEKESDTALDSEDLEEETIFERRKSESHRSFDDNDTTYERKKKTDKKMVVPDEWDFTSSSTKTRSDSFPPFIMDDKNIAAVSTSAKKFQHATIAEFSPSTIIEGTRKEGLDKLSNSKYRVNKRISRSRMSTKHFSPLFSTTGFQKKN